MNSVGYLNLIKTHIYKTEKKIKFYIEKIIPLYEHSTIDSNYGSSNIAS